MPAPPSDRLELQADRPLRESSGAKWRKWGTTAALGLTALSTAASFTGPGQAVIQMVTNPNGNPGLSLVEQLEFQGYAGEMATDRSRVIEVLKENFDVFDSPAGHLKDGKFGIRDLQRVAADESLESEVREVAQALLADPVLLKMLDVAHGKRVDHVISMKDLRVAWENEQGGDIGGFDDVRRLLETPVDGLSPFEYFDSLGNRPERFSWDELELAISLEETPDPFKELADSLLANPNYMNAFDVGSARGYTGVLSLVNPAQHRDGVVSAADLEAIAYSPLPRVGLQFTPQDQEALDRILSGEAELDPNLFTAFRQTNRGNCVSTAIIKAAMDTYGPEIFQQVDKQDDGSYLVTMKDGFQLQISPSELEAAATAANFEGRGETRSLATLAFASMAKRAWMLKHEGAPTYGYALLSLNNGEYTVGATRYLGLRDRVEKISLDEVAESQGAVVYGSGHAYFVDQWEGEVVGDKWGRPTTYEGLSLINEGEPQTGAFILRP